MGSWVLIVLLVPYFVVLITTILRGDKLRIQPAVASDWPMISVVIPTYNEEKRIQAKLREILGLDYPSNKCELVLVDESTDATEQLAKKLAEEYERKITILHNDVRLGLARALDRGYRASSGRIIVKTDCDARIPNRKAFKIAVAYLSDSRIGAVAGTYTSETKRERVYRKALKMWQVAQANLFSTIIAHGCMMAFKREVYAGLNPNSLADDTEIFIDAIAKGFRTIVLPEIECIEQSPTTRRACLRQRSRRAEGIIRLLLGRKGRALARTSLRALLLAAGDLYLIAVSPFAIATLLGFLVLQFSSVGWSGLFAASMMILGVATVWVHGHNIVASFLDTQLAGAVGLASAIRPTSGIFERLS